MELEFTAAEAYMLAEQVEKKAAVFYLDAADNCTNQTVRRLFVSLSRMETDHAEVFAAMRENLAAAPSSVPTGATAQAQNQDQPQLPGDLWPALAGSMIDALDNELPTFFSRNQTSQDILRGAMSFERETITFLVGMKNMMSTSPDKARLDSIILEELGHVLQLSSQLASL